MTENNKPVTKYVLLKVVYNSYYVEPPETWDWNELVGCDPDESVDVIRVSDIPIVDNLF
jgi:hypothetical protein